MFFLDRNAFDGNFHQLAHDLEFFNPREEIIGRFTAHVFAMRINDILHDVEGRHVAAFDMSCLGFDVFQYPGILLLRHDRRADGTAVGNFDVAEIGRSPDIQILAEAGEGVGRNRQSRENIRREITGSHAVDGIIDRGIEAQ